MPSSYSTNLRLELQKTGENRATWGQKANTVFELVDEAISGKLDVTVADVGETVLTVENGISDQSRPMMLKFVGALTANRTIVFPSGRSKVYIVNNATTGGFAVTLKVGSSTYLLKNGQQKIAYTDGITLWTNDAFITPSAADGRWNIPVVVDSSGRTEVGRSIDFHNANADSSDFSVRLDTGSVAGITDLYITPSTVGAVAAKIWTAANDGSGSGMDADLVDGKHASELSFPAGTQMLFANATAPTGWTKNVAINDHALRVVSGGSGGGVGGSVNFSSAFSQQTVAGSVGNYTLTIADLPAHAHAQQGTFTSGTESANHTHVVNGSTGTESADHTHLVPGYSDGSGSGAQLSMANNAGGFKGYTTTSGRQQAHYHDFSVTSGGISTNHTHGTTISGNTANAGGGGGHTHTFTGSQMDLRVKYVDLILATKS